MTKPLTIELERRKGLNAIEFVFILLCCLFYTNFEIQAQFDLVSPFIALGYSFFFYQKEPSCRIFTRSIILSVLLLAIMYTVLTDANTISGSFLKIKQLYVKFSQYILVVFPIFLFYRVNAYASKKQLIIIIATVLLFCIMLARVAIQFAQANALILHSMDANILEEANVTMVAFYFVYLFTFIIITGIILIRHSNDKLVKYISIALIVFSLYFLSVAQFALSFVTTALSVMYYYLKTSRSQYKFLVILALAVLAFILPFVLKVLISITEGELLSARFTEIYNSLTGQSNPGEVSDLQARLDLYWMCIVKFFESPIIGNRQLPFNGHSTFLTAFADLGIFGGLLLCSIFRKSFRFFKSSLGGNYIYYLPLVCQIILMGLTNPIHSAPANFIMLFFLCPLIINYYIK